jgi:HK97 family phage portal protein
MRLFGWDLTLSRTKAASLPVTTPTGWDWSFGLPSWGAPIISEPFTGAWQRNMERGALPLTSYYAIYACITLIASDISKCRLRLMTELEDGTEQEIESASFSPVLRKPNRYQTRIRFIEQWVLSKLSRGNAYVLKERDERKVVVALYVLDPGRVKPLIAPDGAVYYDVGADLLAGMPEGMMAIPASEIIHDANAPIGGHPLCGVSPLYGCALAALQGLNIQRNSSNFFLNGSQPGGIISAPGAIPDTTAKRIKEYWDQNYTGQNVGKVAVLGDGLKYEAMSVSAHDAQLIEQLKWTAEMVCSCFHVPPYKVGIGATPAYNNIQALNTEYYSQALQNPMESIELLMDEGLALPKQYGTEFALDDLLRMDTATQVESVKNSIGAGFMSPNEARAKFGLGPVEGGESPYLQQQNYSLADLAKRGAPPATSAPAPSADAPPPSQNQDEESEDESEPSADARFLRDEIIRRSRHHAIDLAGHTA